MPPGRPRHRYRPSAILRRVVRTGQGAVQACLQRQDVPKEAEKDDASAAPPVPSSSREGLGGRPCYSLLEDERCRLDGHMDRLMGEGTRLCCARLGGRFAVV